jgi:hypothetical protein
LTPAEITAHGFDWARDEALLRLAFGKNAIDKETKPGELILVETPEAERAGAFDFYHKLFAYARAIGRRVESIESGLLGCGGRLDWASNNLPDFPPGEQERVLYLVGPRRDKSMQRIIQSRKPRMIIVASGHAIAIKKEMKPKNHIFYKKLPASTKRAWLAFGKGLARKCSLAARSRAKRGKRLAKLPA